MAGFELEALEPAAPPFTGVVVAEIAQRERHPQADKLQVCRVSTGQRRAAADRLRREQCARGTEERAGHRRRDAARATSSIKAAKLRGVESAGHAVLGQGAGPRRRPPRASSSCRPMRPWAGPCATTSSSMTPVLELNVTPNRGDAMSVLGIAREVAALTGSAASPDARIAACCAAAHRHASPVQLDAPGGLPDASSAASFAASTTGRRRRCGCASACAAPACAPSARSSTSPTT